MEASNREAQQALARLRAASGEADQSMIQFGLAREEYSEVLTPTERRGLDLCESLASVLSLAADGVRRRINKRIDAGKYEVVCESPQEGV